MFFVINILTPAHAQVIKMIGLSRLHEKWTNTKNEDS
jgi:hypothetical protein